MLEDHVPESKLLPFIIENGHITWRQGIIKGESNSAISESIVPLKEQKPLQNDFLKTLTKNNSNENSLFLISGNVKITNLNKHIFRRSTTATAYSGLWKYFFLNHYT